MHCLRVSIDSCWARIISSCSLWTWAFCSKRLVVSSGVFAIYAKASFSTKEFKACDFMMAECDAYFDILGKGIVVNWGYHASLSAGMLVYSFRFSVRLVKADSRLFTLTSARCSAWTHHVRSNFRVLCIRECSLSVGTMLFG